PIKGSLEFIEDINPSRIKSFFANYGFIKAKDFLIFYNGNTLYKLSIENNSVTVNKFLDGIGNLKDVYTFEFTDNLRDTMLSLRENFTISKFRNYLYFCNLTEKEQGQSKVIIRQNIFNFGAYTIPMKYPRFFRSFLLFDLNNQKVEYFYTGEKKNDAPGKFSCQDILKLDKRHILISGVYGEDKEPYSHYVINFDLVDKKIIWQTFISSGFVERNLFNNPVWESWSSPLACKETYCIYTNDLGIVASIDPALGIINWMVNLPVYKFKGTLVPTYFDKMPYFTENKPPLIYKNNIFVQIVSNPVVYKLYINNPQIPLVYNFEGEITKDKKDDENGRIFFTTFFSDVDAPRFFYLFKRQLFFIHDFYLKIKDAENGRNIYNLSFPAKLDGKPLLFDNMLLIPLSNEIIIFSLEALKILYEIRTPQKKFIAAFHEKDKIYVLFMNELTVITIGKKEGEGRK
ncbi:MAG: hypothetical protein ACK4NF_07280, partial [Planctomycetota bacterium]